MGVLNSIKNTFANPVVASLIGPTMGLCAYGYSIAPQMFHDFYSAYRKDNEQRVEPDGKTPLHLSKQLRRLKRRIFFHLNETEDVSEHTVVLLLSRKFNIDHFGSIKSSLSKGCILDIPIYFNWQKSSDMERYKNLFHLEVPVAVPVIQQPSYVSIDWNSTAGQKYQDSFLLSEEAKQFAMATEICLSNINMFTDSVAILRGSAVCGAILSSKMLKSVFRTPRVVTPVVYLMWFFVYSGSRNLILRQRLKSVHQKLVSIDKIYVEGGTEYYSKLLQRNVAIRQMLGAEGEKLYSPMGNEIIPFYKLQPFMLSEKLNLMQTLAKTTSDSS